MVSSALSLMSKGGPMRRLRNTRRDLPCLVCVCRHYLIYMRDMGYNEDFCSKVTQTQAALTC